MVPDAGGWPRSGAEPVAQDLQLPDGPGHHLAPQVLRGIVGDNGRLRWLVECDGVRIDYDKDPNSSWWQRLFARIVQLLPVEEQLQRRSAAPMRRGAAAPSGYLMELAKNAPTSPPAALVT